MIANETKALKNALNDFIDLHRPQPGEADLRGLQDVVNAYIALHRPTAPQRDTQWFAESERFDAAFAEFAKESKAQIVAVNLAARAKTALDQAFTALATSQVARTADTEEGNGASVMLEHHFQEHAKALREEAQQYLDLLAKVLKSGLPKEVLDYDPTWMVER
jgi:hypothetical protein